MSTLLRPARILLALCLTLSVIGSTWAAGAPDPATACKSFFVALENQDYGKAWKLLDKTSQDTIVSAAEQDEHLSASQARAKLNANDSSLRGFWSSLRKAARSDLYVKFSYKTKSISGSSSMVEVKGPGGTIPLQAFRESDGWKFGLTETNTALTNKSK